MAEAIEEENQGIKRTLKDLFGGAVGGVAQVLIGMFQFEILLYGHWESEDNPPLRYSSTCHYSCNTRWRCTRKILTLRIT